MDVPESYEVKKACRKEGNQVKAAVALGVEKYDVDFVSRSIEKSKWSCFKKVFEMTPGLSGEFPSLSKKGFSLSQVLRLFLFLFSLKIV